jgi:putative peptidoglycan binding protein
VTVATKYFNWQSAGAGNKYYNRGASPNEVQLRLFVMRRWTGLDLGIFGVRDVRGGTSLSTHAFGAAWDWRYMDSHQLGSPGRGAVDWEVLPFLTEHSAELGIQLIVDYFACMYWNANRTGGVADAGWKAGQPDNYGMGQPWGGWLHIEVHPDNWQDARPVEEKLGLSNPDIPVFAPERGLFGLYPAMVKPIIRQGAQGDIVRYLQGVMLKLGYNIKVDGAWGPITNNFVVWFQVSHGLVGDGICGPKTWAAVDAIAVT